MRTLAGQRTGTQHWQQLTASRGSPSGPVLCNRCVGMAPDRGRAAGTPSLALPCTHGKPECRVSGGSQGFYVSWALKRLGLRGVAGRPTLRCDVWTRRWRHVLREQAFTRAAYTQCMTRHPCRALSRPGHCGMPFGTTPLCHPHAPATSPDAPPLPLTPPPLCPPAPNCSRPRVSAPATPADAAASTTAAAAPAKLPADWRQKAKPIQPGSSYPAKVCSDAVAGTK